MLPLLSRKNRRKRRSTERLREKASVSFEALMDQLLWQHVLTPKFVTWKGCIIDIPHVRPQFKRRVKCQLHSKHNSRCRTDFH